MLLNCLIRSVKILGVLSFLGYSSYAFAEEISGSTPTIVKYQPRLQGRICRHIRLRH